MVEQYTWWVHKGKTTLYARANTIGKSKVYLHRLLMGVSDPTIIADHINGNGLDNRRCNLRLCTTAENSRNQCVRKNNTSTAKGVSWYKHSGKWRAYIVINYKQKHLGYFDTVAQAEQAYIDAAQKYFGEFTRGAS